MTLQILLVDDHDHFRHALRQRLERLGYAVAEAGNGREALASVSRSVPDLVITDILMPDTDGLEVIMGLKRQAPDLPVIAMSGGGRVGPESYLPMARMLGARQVLHKPFDFNDLISSIECLVRRETPNGVNDVFPGA